MNLRPSKKTLAAAAAALVIAPLGACGGGEGAATAEGEEGVGSETASSVSYGGQTIVPDLVFRGKDWGEPHDVQIEHVRFPSGGEAFEALLAGDVNVSNGGSGRLITVAAQRPDAVSIIAKWQYGGSRYSLLLPKDSDISGPADFKGKTVAVDTGSGAFTLFQVWLEQNGLSPDDVRIIETEVDSIGAALQAGSADVGIAWEPTASLLVEKDLVERFTTLEEAGQSPNFLIADKEWAEQNRDAVVKFLEAAVEVGELIAEDPEAAGEMAAEVSREEGVQVPANALAEALRHIQMEPAIDQASLDELGLLAQEMVDQQMIPQVPDFEPMVDSSYLDEALGQ